ncbi:hypothetical protein FHT91_003477 [Rhizobium sp. BK347]|nr:hypothetical protein [Rhizobium sp. BK252]MBB3403238.1 hypothetical protein [Rhizobium sp. BK289]MBB3415813.1 hypothetical protein [Rhizobium sp. BK284]MBB3483701.1 hypothetical protein [Rhizobium sp. BK347]
MAKMESMEPNVSFFVERGVREGFQPEDALEFG